MAEEMMEPRIRNYHAQMRTVPPRLLQVTVHYLGRGILPRVLEVQILRDMDLHQLATEICIALDHESSGEKHDPNRGRFYHDVMLLETIYVVSCFTKIVCSADGSVPQKPSRKVLTQICETQMVQDIVRGKAKEVE